MDFNFQFSLMVMNEKINFEKTFDRKTYLSDLIDQLIDEFNKRNEKN